MNEKLMPTMMTNWKIWPLLQLINFKFVPIQFQVLYVNFMAVWWNAYLSFIKNSAQPAEASNELDLYESVFINNLRSAKAFE